METLLPQLVKLLVSMHLGEDENVPQEEIWAARDKLQIYWDKYARKQVFTGEVVLVEVRTVFDITVTRLAQGVVVEGLYLYYED